MVNASIHLQVPTEPGCSRSLRIPDTPLIRCSLDRTSAGSGRGGTTSCSPDCLDSSTARSGRTARSARGCLTGQGMAGRSDVVDRVRSSCLPPLLLGWFQFLLEPCEVVGKRVAHPVAELAEQLGLRIPVPVSAIGDLWWPVLRPSEPGTVVGAPVETADDRIAAALIGADIALAGTIWRVGLGLVEAGDEDREALRPPLQQLCSTTIDQWLGGPVIPTLVVGSAVAGRQGQLGSLNATASIPAAWSGVRSLPTGGGPSSEL